MLIITYYSVCEMYYLDGANTVVCYQVASQRTIITMITLLGL